MGGSAPGDVGCLGEGKRYVWVRVEVEEVFAMLRSVPGFQLSWKGAATWLVYLFFSLFCFWFLCFGLLGQAVIRFSNKGLVLHLAACYLHPGFAMHGFPGVLDSSGSAPTGLAGR